MPCAECGQEAELIESGSSALVMPLRVVKCFHYRIAPDDEDDRRALVCRTPDFRESGKCRAAKLAVAWWDFHFGAFKKDRYKRL